MFGPQGIRNVECWVCLLNALNKLWPPTADMCTWHELFNCLIVKILSVVKDLERVQLRTVFLKVYNRENSDAITLCTISPHRIRLD